MKLASLPLALVVIVTLIGCKQTNEVDTEAEIKRVESVAHGLMAADNDRDVGRVMELYSADAILMPPGESPVEGIDALRPRYEQFFRTHDTSLAFEIEETALAGNIAFVRGRTLGKIRNRDAGTEQSINDVFLMILRRSEEGNWQISRLMFHPGTS